MADPDPSNADRASRVLQDTYRRRPVTLVRGQGCYVETDDGRRLLDLLGGIAVSVLGHGRPELIEAASQQLGRLVHTSNLYYTLPQLELAERLVATAFPSRVFFSNSGTEANEAAIKVARKWGRINRSGAHTILTLEGAFHGRTLGALAATGKLSYSQDFVPLPAGFRQLPGGDLGAMEAALTDEQDPAVAILVEPIQGESGVVVLEDSYLRGLRELADRHRVLLMLDEVQSGMGRSGCMWAHQHAGIVPDVMTVAKGLAGGLPLGATLVAPRADVFAPGDHGSTFGGNPVSCAAGVAVLSVIESEELAGNAEARGAQLRRGLQLLAQKGLPVAEVRGRGLLIGIGLSQPIAAEVAQRALELGALVNPIGKDTIRLAPPLVLSEAEAESGLRLLEAAISQVMESR